MVYSEKSIKVLVGLDAIRSKPAMYAGLMDSTGLWTLVREAADNAVDEFKAKRNKSVTIAFDSKLNRVWVIDEGLGIPIGTHIIEIEGRKIKESTFKSVVSRIHAGGKLVATDAYKHSGGTHGVGIKLCTALSKVFEAYTFREGSWYKTEYRDSKEVKDVHKTSAPKLPYKLKAKSGTIISWIPDLQFFDKGSKMPIDTIKLWCELAAYLNAGLKTTFILDGKKTEWLFKRGVHDYLDAELEKLKATATGKPLIINDNSVAAEIAIAFTDAEGQENLVAYTNSIKNKNGGRHVEKLKQALYDVISTYANTKQKFRKDDILEGIVGVINAKLDAPKFSSQDKSELVDSRVDELLGQPLIKAIETFFKANKALAKSLCEKASSIREAKAEFTASKKAIAALNAGKRNGTGLPTKFSGAKCSPAKRETYAVEGDSAGGTAKKARDKSYQEILPLRGKILNVMKTKDPNAAFSSDEVLFILRSIGFDPTKKNPLDNLRTSKFIILTDADVDGRHIEALVHALFVKYIPGVYDLGLIYTIDSPEFTYEHYDKKTKKRTWYYDKSRQSLAEKVKAIGGDTREIKHLKGWGEASPEMLRQCAFDPTTRNIKQLKFKDAKDITSFVKLMADDTATRKKLLGIT